MTLPPSSDKLIEFSNPVFKNGVNLTVRRGTKWHGVDRAFIQLSDFIRHGTVALATEVKVFNELTDVDLIDEHDPSCRTVEGLAAEMKRVYPEFEVTDEVTLVKFILRMRTPVIGDNVWLPDMFPCFVGLIEDVVPLNDDFYEIKFGSEDQLSRRSIVHAVDYLYNVYSGQNGWVAIKTY